MNIQQYAYSMSSLLSKLKYGEGGETALSEGGGRSRHLPPGMCVTMLAGMQYPKYYFEEAQMVQGLIRRLILIFKSLNDMNRYSPFLDTERSDDLYPSLRRIADRLFKRMVELEEFQEKTPTYHPGLYDRVRTSIHTIPAVYDKINEIDEKNRDRAKEMERTHSGMLPVDELYKASIAEHYYCLAGVRCLGRSMGKEPFPTISKDDLIEVNGFYQSAQGNIAEVIDSISVKSRPPRSDEETLDMFYRHILSKGEEGCPHSELYRVIQLKASEMS